MNMIYMVSKILLESHEILRNCIGFLTFDSVFLQFILVVFVVGWLLPVLIYKLCGNLFNHFAF